jgi:prepilin-type N-terminal cleavage/methylation domain-containing protein
MRLSRHDRAGFTLIELVVVMAITVILMLGLVVANFRSTATWVSETKRAELEQNLRYAADIITSDVRQAVSFQTVGNIMTDQLTIEYEDPQRSYHRVRAEYYRVPTSEKRAKIVRDRLDLTTGEDLLIEDITEEITSISSAYFVVRGPRVTVILVAQFLVGSTPKSVTYVAQA